MWAFPEEMDFPLAYSIVAHHKVSSLLPGFYSSLSGRTQHNIDNLHRENHDMQ